MMFSIGSAFTLSAYQIFVCVNCSGVSQNMWDKTFFNSTYFVNVVTHNSLVNSAVIDAVISKYNSQRTGILINSDNDFLAFKKLFNESLFKSTRKVLNDAYRLNWPNVKYLELDMYFGDQLLPLSVNIIEKNFAALLPDLTVSFFCDNVIILSNNTSVLSVVSLN